MASPSSLPPNVHISKHPCLIAKISQLRSHRTTSREVKQLVHDIALIIGVEALASGLQTASADTDTTPLGYEYATQEVLPQRISLVPVLRSGLGMLDAIETLLPAAFPIHHLGLFRDPSTLSAVEYYNNLPYSTSTPPSSSTTPSHPTPPSHSSQSTPSDLVLLLDPVIATGATASAAIETLRDWGAKRIIMLSVIASVQGLRQAAEQWPEGVEIWTGSVDEDVDGQGMIRPGLGDVGDRLFLTLGK